MKQNFFETLNAALDAEGLIQAWNPTNAPIQYGETRQWAWDDGTRWGRWVSVYRDEQGRYERPVHYSRG